MLIRKTPYHTNHTHNKNQPTNQKEPASQDGWISFLGLALDLSFYKEGGPLFSLSSTLPSFRVCLSTSMASIIATQRIGEWKATTYLVKS